MIRSEILSAIAEAREDLSANRMRTSRNPETATILDPTSPVSEGIRETRAEGTAAQTPDTSPEVLGAPETS